MLTIGQDQMTTNTDINCPVSIIAVDRRLLIIVGSRLDVAVLKRDVESP